MVAEAAGGWGGEPRGGGVMEATGGWQGEKGSGEKGPLHARLTPLN